MAVLLLGACAAGVVPGDAGPSAAERRALAPERLAAAVTVVRDEWGVPHIHGRTDAAVAFGVAYAQAEDDFRQLEDNYIHALGRAANYYGDVRVPHDLVRAAFDVERTARDEYGRLPPPVRMLLDAYTAGLNHFLRSHPDLRPRLLHEFEAWQPLALARDLAPVLLATGLRPELTAAPADDRAVHAPQASLWAVAPGRTVAGSALLLHDAEYGFDGAGTAYEMVLRSDAGWRFAGFTLLGTIVPHVGHNDRVAWAHAVTGRHTVRTVPLEFDDPADPLAYRDADGRQRATDRAVTLHINTHDGVVTREYRVLHTRHGPVVRRPDGIAVAVVGEGAGAGEILTQWYTLGRAGSAAEFQGTLVPAALPRGDLVFADVDGHVMYVETGAGTRRVEQVQDWIAATEVARAGAVEQLLARATAWDFAAWAASAFDAELRDAEAEIATLVREWERLGVLEPERALRLEPVVDTLRLWDRRADIASVPTTYFVLLREQLLRDDGGAYPRVHALERAIAALRAEHGSPAVAWGELNRLQRPGADPYRPFRDAAPSLAVAGMPAMAGAVQRYTARPAPGTRRRYGANGHIWVAELMPGGPRAHSVVRYGQNGDPASDHHADQAALFAAGRLKRVTPIDRAGPALP